MLEERCDSTQERCLDAVPVSIVRLPRSLDHLDHFTGLTQQFSAYGMLSHFPFLGLFSTLRTISSEARFRRLEAVVLAKNYTHDLFHNLCTL